MRRSIRLLIAVLGILFAVPSFPQKTEVDSLLQVIKESSGEKKLELLDRLTTLERDNKGLLQAANMMGQEAKNQNNKKYLVRSYEFKARYYLYKNGISNFV